MSSPGGRVTEALGSSPALSQTSLPNLSQTIREAAKTLRTAAHDRSLAPWPVRVWFPIGASALGALLLGVAVVGWLAREPNVYGRATLTIGVALTLWTLYLLVVKRFVHGASEAEWIGIRALFAILAGAFGVVVHAHVGFMLATRLGDHEAVSKWFRTLKAEALDAVTLVPMIGLGFVLTTRWRVEDALVLVIGLALIMIYLQARRIAMLGATKGQRAAELRVSNALGARPTLIRALWRQTLFAFWGRLRNRYGGGRLAHGRWCLARPHPEPPHAL